MSGGRRGPLVLSEHGRDLVREDAEDARRTLGHDLRDAALVRLVGERPEERDRDRLDAVGHERVDRLDDLVLLQLDDHVAVAVDPLRDAADQAARDDRLGLAERRGVHEVALGQPGDLRVHLADDDRVLVPLGRDQARSSRRFA